MKNVREPRIDVTLANARGQVGSGESTGQVMLSMHVESAGIMPHSFSVFFEPSEARSIGEALMREAYRMEQIQKLKTEPVELPTYLGPADNAHVG